MATEPRWLDETEMAAWHFLVVAGMHMFAALDRDLRDAFDVTLLDHGILLMLRNSPEGLTMGHLASQFGTEASVITKAGRHARSGTRSLCSATTSRLVTEAAPVEGIGGGRGST
jgi:hypothetical protein